MNLASVGITFYQALDSVNNLLPFISPGMLLEQYVSNQAQHTTYFLQYVPYKLDILLTKELLTVFSHYNELAYLAFQFKPLNPLSMKNLHSVSPWFSCSKQFR